MFIPRLVLDGDINGWMTQVGELDLTEALYLRSTKTLELDVSSLQRQGSYIFVDSPTAIWLTKPEDVEVEACAHASGLGPTDRIGRRMKDAIPMFRGLTGTVRGVGAIAQTRMNIGDIVIGWNFHGLAYSNHPCADVRNVARIPGYWSLPVTVASMVPLMAVHCSLFEFARLREGQSILICDAASLYGQIAVAMAKSTRAALLMVYRFKLNYWYKPV